MMPVGVTTGWRDHLLGASLCCAYIALLLATAGELGMSRDESMYVHAADRYAGWLELLVSDPGQATQRQVIDHHWKANREHPPLAKLLFAAGHLVQKHYAAFSTPSLAYRAGGMLCAGLLLWLIYVFGAQLYGRAAGLMAALLYALMPRPFYHAHLTCFDVPITLAIVFCAYAYMRSLREPRWLLVLGGGFGLALATKHNSWVLPGIFGIHFAWLHLMQARAGGGPVGRNPRFLWAMALLGPPIMLLLWPWVWNDTAERLGWYVAFHMKHDYYNIAYFGENYFWPPFPISFPWLMTWMTVPITTLLLAAVGVVVAGHAVLQRFRQRVAAADPRQPAVLLLGCMLAPLVVISLPSTPIFGGTKHWMTAYPFLCLFAGLAFASVTTWAMERFGRGRWASFPNAAVVSGGLAAVVLLSPAALETWHSHPMALSHYGVGAGGIPGSADLGMNRQFWGFTTRSVTEYLAEHAPRGGRIYICDTTGGAFRMLQKDGWLPKHLRPTRDIAFSDYAIVHHEHHFAEVDHQIWSAYGSVKPVHVLTYDGVPIVSVYRNPRRR